MDKAEMQARSNAWFNITVNYAKKLPRACQHNDIYWQQTD